MTKTLKINHERMQHAPAIVIDGAPVLSSRFITQLRKWLSHVLRQRVPFSTICPPSSWAALAGSPPTRRAHACRDAGRSEEHTSELQSLMRISYAVFCLKKKKKQSYIK